MFSDEELELLRGFPEISREELIRYFTLTPADVAFVDPGRGRGPADRLGLALQLCTLPWLGFVPDDVTIAPTHHENVNFYGSHSVDIDRELAELGQDGYRPLR